VSSSINSDDVLKRIKVNVGRDYPRIHLSDKARVNHREILSQLPTRYFASSKRLRCDKPIASVEVIADTQYYEEGDWWALTLLSINHADDRNSLAFLPIMHTIIPSIEQDYCRDIDRLLAGSPELIAYGIGTKFRYRRGNNWVAYDAFCDESFAKILLRLFWPNRTFYSLGTDSDGEEAITFTSSKDVSDYVVSNKVSTEVQRSGDVKVSCGELTLMIPKACGGIHSIEEEGMEEIGRIEYRFEENVITIGVLFR
jgi:hypothetical protein